MKLHSNITGTFMSKTNSFVTIILLLTLKLFATEQTLPSKILFIIKTSENIKINGKRFPKDKPTTKLTTTKEEKTPITSIELETKEESDEQDTDKTNIKEKNSSDTNDSTLKETDIRNTTEDETSKSENIKKSVTNDNRFLSENDSTFYKERLEQNRVDIEKKLFALITQEHKSCKLYRKKEVTKGIPEITVTIEEYNQGEFNFIRDVNTQIRYSITIKNGKKKTIANFRKKYIVRAISSQPLEGQRLSILNKNFVDDLYKLIQKKLYTTKNEIFDLDDNIKDSIILGNIEKVEKNEEK